MRSDCSGIVICRLQFFKMMKGAGGMGGGGEDVKVNNGRLTFHL
jgi:hypothetical protein